MVGYRERGEDKTTLAYSEKNNNIKMFKNDVCVFNKETREFKDVHWNRI